MNIPTTPDEYYALFDSEIMEIAAVTSSSGFVSSWSQNSVYRIAGIFTAAWQDLSSKEIHIERIRLSDMVQNTEELEQKLKKDSIVTLKARKGGDAFNFIRGFNIVEIIEPGNYPELEKILAAQLAPAYHIDEALGKFTLNRIVNQYETAIKWAGRKARLSFDNGAEENIQAALSAAKKLINNQAQWDEQIRRFAAAGDLLNLKNEHWLKDGEKALTEDKFIKKLKINSIIVYPDGQFEFWYDDGGIFWGHSVTVEGSVDKGPVAAKMQ